MLMNRPIHDPTPLGEQECKRTSILHIICSTEGQPVVSPPPHHHRHHHRHHHPSFRPGMSWCSLCCLLRVSKSFTQIRKGRITDNASIFFDELGGGGAIKSLITLLSAWCGRLRPDTTFLIAYVFQIAQRKPHKIWPCGKKSPYATR